MKRVMVMWLDPDEVPRAWAVSDRKEEAEKEATFQLAAYRAKKMEIGDQLAYAEYTMKMVEMEEGNK